MKSKSVFCCITASALLVSNHLWAQARFDWAVSAGGGSPDNGAGVAVDAEGNCYMTGWFAGGAWFGGTFISAPGYDVFLTKYDREGQLIWARSAGGGNNDHGRGLAIDGLGNLFVVGTFQGPSATFGATNLTALSGSDDIFVAKYNVDGDLLWVRQAGGHSSDIPYGIATDANGNIFVSGYFIGTSSFGTHTLTSISGNYDGFVTKLDVEGQFVWAKQLGGNVHDYAQKCASDNQGNVYVTGHFASTAMFDDHCLISRGSEDAFVAKYNGEGRVQWVRQAGGDSADYGWGVRADNNRNVFFTGQLGSSRVYFGSTNIQSLGSYDMYLAKYNSDGDLLWARQAGASSDDGGYDVGIDPNGNSYVTGFFYNSMSFGASNLSGYSYHDIFVAKYNPEGAFMWAVRAGGSSSSDYGNNIAVDSSGACFATGSYYGAGFFGNTTLGSQGNSDVFLVKLVRDLPIIVTQPTSVTVMEGDFAAFGVTVTGTGPFTYQWQKNGTDLLDETNQTLEIVNTTTNDAAAYGVIIGNYEGIVTSLAATLSVNTIGNSVDVPSLTWSRGGHDHWFNQSEFTHDGADALRSGAITHGEQSWMETTVNGPAQVRFYWRISCENGYDFLRLLVNGVEATNTSGKIDWKPVHVNVGAGAQTLRWVYSKDESESVGQDAGWADEVSIIYAPGIIVEPISQTVVAGTTASLTVVNSGTAPFVYQWLHNGSPLEGANSSELILTNVSTNNAGVYSVRINNPGGSVTSADAVLTVQIPPLITLQPMSQTVSHHSDVIFQVQASGQEPLSYQWSRNGAALDDATNATLVLTNVAPGQGGSYAVTVTSPNGSSVSEPALLTVINLYMVPAIQIDGVVGRNYDIRYKNDLRETSWTVLTNLMLAVSPSWHVDLTAIGSPHRFYQVVPTE